MNTIEPLELRIAPAVFFTYTDVDGDLVTVTSSKGTKNDLMGGATFDGTGQRLQVLDLSSAMFGAEFEGANISIIATRGSTGDGHVNVGYINATARNIGSVMVDGDLGRIDAGKGTSTPAIKALSALSMGRFGTSTQQAGGDLVSNINGPIGTLKIGGDLLNVTFFVDGGVNGKIGLLSIGGSLIGSAATSSGRFEIDGAIGAVKIGGDIRGGSGLFSGIINAGGAIGSATVGGSIIGGGDGSGALASSATLGPVKIGGNIQGGNGLISGVVLAGGNIASVTVGGSLFGGAMEDAGQIQSTAGAIGKVTIARDIVGGDGIESGSVLAATLGSVTVGGSVMGSTGFESGRIASTGNMGTVKIGGDIEGGGNTRSGSVSSSGKLASITIGGSLVGGAGTSSGLIASTGDMGVVKIGEDLRGGSGTDSGKIRSEAALTSLNIGGSVVGGTGPESARVESVGKMGVVRIVGDVRGSSGTNSGSFDADGGIGSLTIGGSLAGGSASGGARINGGAAGPIKIAGDIQGGGDIFSGLLTLDSIASITVGGSVIGGIGDGSGIIGSLSGSIGLVKIGGDIRGGAGVSSGEVASATTLGSVTVGGSLIGSSAEDTGAIISNGAMGAVRIGGNIEGGDVASAITVKNTGVIKAQRLASLFVGGSIVSGSESGGGTLINSGAVRVADDLGPVVVKGSLAGNNTNRVLITARGQATPGTTTNLAVTSLTIGGRVEFAEILAGYNTADVPSGVNADAQIGPVVTGDWIASNLVAGVQDDADAARDEFFGDGDDQKIAGGNPAILSKIASITIKRTALGTVSILDHYGFVAQHIGLLKVSDTVFPLAAGAANDLAGLFVGVTSDLRVREVAI